MPKLTDSQSNYQRQSPLICRICGDIARGLNFSVISCMSCKMFFRRHAESSLSKHRCRFGGHCLLTRRTRKCCLPCRLKRCFEAGMDVHLIRHTHTEKKLVPLPQPRPISLMYQDRSMLTLDEWKLLSNIVNTYDEQNLLPQAKSFLKGLDHLPFKQRTKGSTTLSHIESLFLNVYKFIERCPFFYSLPIQLRQILIKRNLRFIGGFSGFFLAHQMKIFENENYSKYIDNIYGDNYSKSIIKASQRLPQNEALIKISLLLIIFLSNSGIIAIDISDSMNTLLDLKTLVDIENIIVTMLWKYLMYQYGFYEAASVFLSLIKSVLGTIDRMHAGLNIQMHWNMVGKVVQQATKTLTVKDVSYAK